MVERRHRAPAGGPLSSLPIRFEKAYRYDTLQHNHPKSTTILPSPTLFCISTTATMRFPFRTLLACVAATNLTVDAFAPSSLRTAPSVRPWVSSPPASLPSSSSSSNNNKWTVLAASTTADAVPAEEPKPQGTGTATISDVKCGRIVVGLFRRREPLVVQQPLLPVLLLVKGIVGAGVLSLPAGIAAFGNAPSAVLPAVVLIAAIGALSAYGFALTGRVCALTKATTYRAAWSESMGAKSSWIPAWTVTFKTFCAILAYSMILGETFQSIIAATGTVFSTWLVLPTVTAGVLLPLCMLKNLSSLAPFSLLGSLGMLYTAIIMFWRYSTKAYTASGKFGTDLAPHLQPAFGSIGASGIFNAKAAILLGMLSTAYMAHFNAPKFYTELKDNTVPRYMTVVGTSFGISIGLFASIAAMGFLTFGGNSAGLILSNYSPKDKLMGISKIAVAFSLVFSYPLAFVGFREGVLDLLKVKERKPALLNSLTVGLLSFVTLLALVIPDVSFVLSFAGSTLGNALVYIFPALMFRGAVKKLPSPSKLQKLESKVVVGTGLFGLIMGALGAVKAVQSIM
eukprot:scaffold11046_cov183-Amphora_coffeaeformis.AAC.1